MNRLEYTNIMSTSKLFDAAIKCGKGHMWKSSVCSFLLNAPYELPTLSEKILSGEYEPGRTKSFIVYVPKKRVILPNNIKDRVIETSFHTNVLVPYIHKRFIYANVACQPGKGWDCAHKLTKKYLTSYFLKNKTNEGYVCQFDFKSYFDSIDHEILNNLLSKYIPDTKTADVLIDKLNKKFTGTKGYNPGAVTVQTAGVLMLDKLDHLIKEKLRIKHYIRYMDDGIAIVRTREEAKACLKLIQDYATEHKLTLNYKKTGIFDLTNGIPFIGNLYRLTSSGAIVATLLQEKVRTIKNHYSRMLRLVAEKQLDLQIVRNLFNDRLFLFSYKPRRSNGKRKLKCDSYYLIQNLKEWFENKVNETITNMGKIKPHKRHCKVIKVV